jgi:hypothetical protein
MSLVCQALLYVYGLPSFIICLWSVKLYYMYVVCQALLYVCGLSSFIICLWSVKLYMSMVCQALLYVYGLSSFIICLYYLAFYMSMVSQALLYVYGHSSFIICLYCLTLLFVYGLSSNKPLINREEKKSLNEKKTQKVFNNELSSFISIFIQKLGFPLQLIMGHPVMVLMVL